MQTLIFIQIPKVHKICSVGLLISKKFEQTSSLTIQQAKCKRNRDVIEQLIWPKNELEEQPPVCSETEL